MRLKRSAQGAGSSWLDCPSGRSRMDLVALSAKEASIETVFRYAHVYPRALALMGSGKIDVKPLISRTFEFQRQHCRRLTSR